MSAFHSCYWGVSWDVRFSVLEPEKFWASKMSWSPSTQIWSLPWCSLSYFETLRLSGDVGSQEQAYFQTPHILALFYITVCSLVHLSFLKADLRPWSHFSSTLPVQLFQHLEQVFLPVFQGTNTDFASWWRWTLQAMF